MEIVSLIAAPLSAKVDFQLTIEYNAFKTTTKGEIPSNIDWRKFVSVGL